MSKPRTIIEAIRDLAKEGYGIEDIAVRLNLDPRSQTLRDIVLKKDKRKAA